MAYNNENLLNRISEICEFAYRRYEQGRQDRSWRWVWRYHVHPTYHISFRTFKQYLKVYKKQLIIDN
ncbi:MAG: hypothetical protein LBC68_07050 [Prevotellaceae bacterium]|jgi:hypothetical protein|nr:hypothetical protein [Prevotellaceae bacterium]